MIFTSIVFFLFFIAMVLVYYALPHKLRWLLLLLSGIFFYMYAGPSYVAVPVAIIVVTYFAGIGIEKAKSSREAKWYYLSGIIANVGLLVFLNTLIFLFRGLLISCASPREKYSTL